MQYTQLGERGPRVSRIAFGNWSAGGDWGGVDRDAAIAATRSALDLGITLFDTARAYGFGAAEQLLGEALRPEIRSARESIVIATKGGLRNDGGSPVRDSSQAALRRDLESSLRFLGTDYVDLYQVHWPDPATPIAETAETLDAFVREGKVRFVGVSNFDAREMTTFQGVRPLDTLQPPYHMANSMLADVILSAAELQVAGEGAGLDPSEVFWVLKRVAPGLEARQAGLVEDRHTPTLFALRDLRKDVDLAMALFGRSDAQTPLTRLSSELVDTAAAVTPDLDISAVVRPYRQVRRSPRTGTGTATPLVAAAAR